MARVALGICYHNTLKLQNPPHVAAREGKGARAKGKTTGERGKTAEATQKQREGGSGKQGRSRTNRSRAGASGRSSVDRSLEHATSEEPTREGRLCGVGGQCQRGRLAQGTRVTGHSNGAENRKRHIETQETQEVLSMHLDCEPFGTEWVYWTPRERNAAADSLATRAVQKREDAFFLNSRWHTDKWSRADVVLTSDAGIRDSPSRPGVKQQGIGFLMMHQGTWQLLAAASFYEETRAKQDDINILELSALQSAAGMMMAARAGKAGQLTSTRASEFTRPELRTLKTQSGEAMPGHLAVPRMQCTLTAMGDEGVGDSTVGAVEHLGCKAGKWSRRAGSATQVHPLIHVAPHVSHWSLIFLLALSVLACPRAYRVTESTSHVRARLKSGTLGEHDHNTRNEMLKLFTEHHTGLFVQSCLRDEELGRTAISCHYAVDCQGRRWQRVVHRKESPRPLNMASTGGVPRSTWTRTVKTYCTTAERRRNYFMRW